VKVRFRLPFYIKGYRFEKGWNDVPDQFKDQLPSDAEVEGAKVKTEAGEKKAKPEKGEKVADHGERAKSYRLPPKVFKDEDAGTEVDREVVLKAAVSDHLAKDPANSIATWNALSEADRKKFMQEKAAELLQPLAA